MIWRKAWLECRFRVWFGAIMAALVVASGLSLLGPAKAWDTYCMALGGLIAIMVVNFAGSGINTQSIWGVFHGFHPSMYFLLSMPVSRRRVLLVRAAVGWLLTMATIAIGAIAFALLEPLRGVSVGPGDVTAAIVFLAIGSAPLFGFVTLLTTFLDETWAGITGYAIGGGFFGFSLAMFEKPARFNPLLFVDGELFRHTHNPHWPAVAAYLAVGLACLMASIFVVERKEY